MLASFPGALKAIAQNHQKLYVCKVRCRESTNVDGEVRNDAGRLEDRPQAFLEVPGLVRLIADQDQGMWQAFR